MENICPKCGSKNIEPAHDRFFKMGRETQQYLCRDCGYMGALVVAKNGDINPKMGEDLGKIKK